MSARQLVETDVELILDQIKSNITAALLEVSNFRTDQKVALDNPKDYFIYPRAQGYRTPCVFVIPDRVDFRKDEKAANFIDATSRINVTVLIEDKDAERLELKCWRYQAALHKVLDQVPLTSDDSGVRITIEVMNAAFSPMYSLTQDPSAPNAVFRKEVVLECDVYHYEANN